MQLRIMLPKSDGKRQGAIGIRLVDRSRWINIKIYSNETIDND